MTDAFLDFLPPKAGFQDPDREGADTPAAARAIVIPFGLEASVSYGGGTRHGPAAILAASQQLELFDEELWREPYRDFGIATLRPPVIGDVDRNGNQAGRGAIDPAAAAQQPGGAETAAASPELAAALEQLAGLVAAVLAAEKFPLVLGGEHSLTAGAIRPFVERYDDLVILQIDAHADLRDGYLGEHYSHASAMRRVLDHPGCSIVALGIRALCQAEADFIDANPARVEIYWAHQRKDWDLARLAASLAGKNIYVTFDLDGLDNAEMPATGTPTPGGLTYADALTVLRIAASAGTIVGADVVELAPIAGFHGYDVTAASIANKILNYALSGTERR